MNAIKKFFLATTLMVASISGQAQSIQQVNGTSWIDNEFPFGPEMTTIKMAQQWALCSATLEVFSAELGKTIDKPATAKLVQQTSNGAAVAVIGTYILGFAREMNDRDVENFAQEFERVVKYGQFASTEFVDKALVFVGAEQERAESDLQWIENLAASAINCMQPPILEFQEMLINIVRKTVMGEPK